MTFAAMQQTFWQRIDQSGSPNFTPAETDRLLNWAYDVWYLINRPKFDINQANTVNMTYLIRPFAFNNKSELTVFGLGTDIPQYRDIARMVAEFDINSCGTVTRQKINVVPMSISERDTNAQDPFNKPSNQYPFYYQTHNGTNRTIKVLSTTTPLSLEGDYFKALQTIDTVNTPGTEFEAQDYVARQVIDIAKILAKGDLDDYAAVKNAVQQSVLSMQNQDA